MKRRPREPTAGLRRPGLTDVGVLQDTASDKCGCACAVSEIRGDTGFDGHYANDRGGYQRRKCACMVSGHADS